MMQTHQPTTQQVSVTEYLEDDADNRTKSTAVTCGGNTRPENVRDDVDPTRKIYLSERCYHRDRGGVPGCPEGHNLPRSTIAEAARQGIPPCRKCNPVDYRIEQEKTELATLEAFQTAQQGDQR